MIRNITIKQKVYFLSMLGIALMVAIGLLAIYSINAIGTQLHQITREDIPLTSKVTEITVHQLEQAVQFERASRYAQLMSRSTSAANNYQAAKADFFKLAEKVDGELLEAEEQAANIIAYEQAHGGSADVVKEFQHVEKILKQMKTEHAAFDNKIATIFTLLEQGNTFEAQRLTAQVEAQESKLTQQLETLTTELKRFTENSANQVIAYEKWVLNMLIMIGTAGSVIFIAAAIFIVRGIVKPLLATKGYADALSEGDLSVAEPQHGFKDEIADMMGSLSVFKQNAIKMQQLQQEQAASKQRQEEEQRQALLDMADQFDQRVSGIVRAIQASAMGLQETAQQLAGAVDATDAESGRVLGAAQNADSNVQTVASAAEELSASLNEVTRTVEKTSALSSTSRSDAETSQQELDTLKRSITDVSNIIKDIEAVTNKTNLLALNATIEASSAGEAGRGFAVVAAEVKSLAAQTAEMTQNIADRIDAVRASAERAITTTTTIINRVEDIDNANTSLNNIFKEQAAATQEISHSAHESANGSAAVAAGITAVQEASTATKHSSQQVKTSADDLAEQANQLQSQVAAFLSEIQAA